MDRHNSTFIGECEVAVEHTLRCGHKITDLCSTDFSSTACLLPCDKMLPCGHKCTLLCGHAGSCDESCAVPVMKTVLLCRDTMKHCVEVPCSKDISDLPCQIQCNDTLPCGHLCRDTCDSCQPTRRSGRKKHQQCVQPCNKPLSCNHKCPGKHLCADGSLCPPCLLPCPTKCSHRSCTLPCGVPCIPCDAPCTYSCKHLDCVALCGEPHDCGVDNGLLDITIERRNGLDRVCACVCTLRLPCGHNCLGFCGEKCPKLCFICEPSDLFASYDVIVTLSCGHSFEESLLYESVMNRCFGCKGSSVQSINEIQDADVKVPSCPTCGLILQGLHRYSSLVRDSMKRLAPENILKLQEHLCREMMDVQSTSTDKIQKLVEMMADTSPGRNYHGLKYTIALMLGKLFLNANNKPEASRNLRLAKGATGTTSWVSVEASICMGFMHLGYSEGAKDGKSVMHNLINRASMNSLERSLKYFEEAHDFFSNNSVSSGRVLKDIFNRDSGILLELMSTIDERMVERNELKRVAEEDAIAASKASSEAATRAAGASTASTPSPFPTIPPPVTPLIKAPAHSGSLLHAAAGCGNLPEVQSH